MNFQFDKMICYSIVLDQWILLTSSLKFNIDKIIQQFHQFHQNKSLVNPLYSILHSIKFYLNNVLCIFIGINCESPGILVNGMVTSNGTYVTSVATFTCDFGYELVGSRQRVCQSDGTWSNMIPRCDRKLLPVLMQDLDLAILNNFSC